MKGASRTTSGRVTSNGHGVFAKQSSGEVIGSRQIESREGSDAPVPLVLGSTEVKRLSPETSPVQSAQTEGFRYCMECDVHFKEYDGIHNKVHRFCSFCGDKLLRAAKHCSGSTKVASKGPAHDPDCHVVDKLSSSATLLDDSIRRHFRSRSPHPRIRENSLDHSLSPYSRLHDGVKYSRSPSPKLQGAKRQRLPTPDDIPNSQREQLKELQRGRARSAPKQEKKKQKIVAIGKTEEWLNKDKRTNGKYDGGDRDKDITDRVAEEKSSRLGESCTQRLPQQPTEDIDHARATSPNDINSAKLGEQLSPAPNVRTAPENRQLEYRRVKLHQREEELKKQTLKLQKEMKKEFSVTTDAQAAEGQRQAKHRRNNLLYREDCLNKQKRILQKRIELEKGKEREIVDLTVDDE